MRGYPQWFYVLGQGDVLGVPTQLWILFAGAVFAAVVLAFTRFGRTVYAIGANETAARFSGLPVDRVKLVLYTASGFCAALAAELDTLPSALRDAVAAFLDKHTAWLERVLREGVANGTVRAEIEPASCARMVLATLEGSLLLERLLAGAQGFGSTLKALRTSLAPPLRS